MTDQGPIDPSTLRDGDIVRAKRGEHGVVEGVFHSYPISSGWGIGSEAEEDGLFAWNDKGWTITAILRPVPVKGDRVEWVGASRKRKASTATVCQVNGDYVAVIRDDDVADKWPIEAVRRLPTAPEPAPIEVGDWWATDSGEVCVVLDVEPKIGDADISNALGIRMLHNAHMTIVNRAVWLERWHRLDDPPEPEVRQVYVIGDQAFVHSSDFGHQVTGASGPSLAWSTICDVWSDRLATLQIVHTLGVE